MNLISQDPSHTSLRDKSCLELSLKIRASWLTRYRVTHSKLPRPLPLKVTNCKQIQHNTVTSHTTRTKQTRTQKPQHITISNSITPQLQTAAISTKTYRAITPPGMADEHESTGAADQKKALEGGGQKSRGKGKGGGGGGRAMEISRALTKFLRHDAAKFGIALDKEAFAPLDRVVS